MRLRHAISIYFVGQALAVSCWWLLLFAYPDSIHWFQPKQWPIETLSSFWLADTLLLVGGSLTASLALGFRFPWATSCVWFIAAAAIYPALYCILVSVQTDEAWIAAGLMTGMAGLSLTMALICGGDASAPKAFRVSGLGRGASVGATFIQTGIFWSIFLWILPKSLCEFQAALGISTFSHPWQTTLATGLFFMGSSLGIGSAIFISTRGWGTPLPTSTASILVREGPYRYVRNPMAIAGITQGLAVGWYLGSVVVIGYAILGALLWHRLVRPVEEAELLLRFGNEYEIYRKQVAVWIPSLVRSGKEVDAT